MQPGDCLFAVGKGGIQLYWDRLREICYWLCSWRTWKGRKCCSQKSWIQNWGGSTFTVWRWFLWYRHFGRDNRAFKSSRESVKRSQTCIKTRWHGNNYRPFWLKPGPWSQKNILSSLFSWEGSAFLQNRYNRYYWQLYCLLWDQRCFLQHLKGF